MTINRPSNAEDTTLSILCSPDQWRWDYYGTSSISFNEKALAEPKLVAGAQIPAYIAAEFEWMLTSPEPLDTIADLSKNKHPKGTLLGQFNIELTLTRRIHPGCTQLLPGFNERFLTDAVFLPKNYTIRLEHGHFMDPAYQHDTASERDSQGFFFRPHLNEFRLVFNKPPYPPLEEWTEEGKGLAEGRRFYDVKEFVDKRLGMASYLTVLVRKITNSG